MIAFENEFREFISRFRWRFATTYAEFCPHEYIVKTKIRTQHWKDFERMVQGIRDYGFDAQYFSKKGKYFIVDEYYYWTMGAPVSETTVLNRAKLADFELVNGAWIRKA
jgi:hypothetical protein